MAVRMSISSKAAAPRNVVAKANNSRRELLSAGLIAVAAVVIAPAANAGVVEDLLAKSSANKSANDKARLATSYANLARSRTVEDGTCTVFTNNFFGCEELAPKPVKFIAEDRELECKGKDAGKCASRMTGMKGLF